MVERERNASGRAQNARPRDALGRPLPRTRRRVSGGRDVTRPNYETESSTVHARTRRTHRACSGRVLQSTRDTVRHPQNKTVKN